MRRVTTEPSRTLATPKAAGSEGGPLPDLAHTGVCVVCRKAYVSVIREFPLVYRCPNCETDRDRTLRIKTAAFLATRPRCGNGHLLTEITLALTSSGARRCRICSSQASSRSAARRADAKKDGPVK